MVERIVPATPSLAERERKAIEDLRALFPDGNVAGLDSKDKALGKRLTKLYRSLGYESRADLIEALGFRQEPQNMGRPVSVIPEELFAELQRRYDGKPKPKSVGILKYDNPDLAGQIKTVGNKCPELYGHTMTIELIERGLLDQEIPPRAANLSDDDIRRAVEELREKYAGSAKRPATLIELKEQEPEYAAVLDILNSRSRKLFGMPAGRYLKDIGVIGKGGVSGDVSEIEAVLDQLQEQYLGLPNDAKPKTIADLLKEHPEHADAINAGRKTGLSSREALLERGILGLSATALKARAKVLKERCVRNATLPELVRMYAGNGGARVVLPGDSVEYLRPGVLGVDFGVRYELREVTFLVLGSSLVVGDELQIHNSEEYSGWRPVSKVTLIKDGAQVGWVQRPRDDDFVDPRTYKVDTPLTAFVGTSAIGVETLGEKQLARVRHRFLAPISRETLLYALYRLDALYEAELYENADSWRERLEQLPEDPFEGFTVEREAPGEPAPFGQGEVSESPMIEPAQLDSVERVAQKEEASEAPNEDVVEEDSGESVEEETPSLEPEAASSDGAWSFSRHQTAKGRRFSIEVPDQYVLTPDKDGRPLAHYVEGIDDESEYPEVIYSSMLGDLDDETREAFRDNLIPETRIQLYRNAIYSNDLANTLSQVVDDWLVDGKNCQVIVFKVKHKSLFPGLTSDSYEYTIEPIAYDHSDSLRVTDSWGHLAEGSLKDFAFAVARSVELDAPVELQRPKQLERFCEEPADADAFCECVAVISKMLNMSNNERMNSNLWQAVRRADNDKGTLLVGHRMQRIQAEAYIVGLEEQVAYYERFVRALEKQAELGSPGLDRMIDIVGQYADAFIVDHISIEDDEDASNEINALGIISIPPAYEALRERYEALKLRPVKGLATSDEEGSEEVETQQTQRSNLDAEEDSRKAAEEARRKAEAEEDSRKAAEEARRKAEAEEARRKAEEEAAAKRRAEEKARREAEAAKYRETEEERDVRLEREIIRLVESGCHDDDEIRERISNDPENKRYQKPLTSMEVRRKIRKLQDEDRIEYYFKIRHSLHRPHWINSRYRWHLANPGKLPADVQGMTGVERARLAHELILDQYEHRTYHCHDKDDREDELAHLAIDLGGGVTEARMITEADGLAYKWITSGAHYNPKLLPANAENKTSFITSALERAVKSHSGSFSPIMVKKDGLYYAWCQRDVSGSPITDPYATVERLEQQLRDAQAVRARYQELEASLSSAEQREAELRNEIRAFGFFGGGAEKRAKKAERAEVQKTIVELRKKLEKAPGKTSEKVGAIESELSALKMRCETMRDQFRWY